VIVFIADMTSMGINTKYGGMTFRGYNLSAREYSNWEE